MFLPSQNLFACFYPFFLLLDHLLFLLLFLLLNSLLFFLLMLLLYFCLLINHVNQPIVFVFGTFVYYFRNTISIFVTICYTRIYIHMSAFLPILETLLKRTFWYRQHFLFRFFFYLLNRSKTISSHRCLQFCEEEKASRKQSPVNTMVKAWVRFCFWPKTHAQASMCEPMRYHGAKSMIGFSTILCISDELIRAIGA